MTPGSETICVTYKPGTYASVTLVRAGLILTAPLVPIHAFAADLLEFYWLLNKHHHRLGLQAFMQMIKEFHEGSSLDVSA